jgi:serine/threonine protein kinase
MASIKQAGAEPFPGYRLSDFLGRGGFGEVWKCQVPGGLCKAVKFVPLDCGSLHQPGSGTQELEAFERIKAIRHPFLLSVERVEIVGDELVMVTELADKSLADRLQECQAQGRPGIAAEELLPLLAEAAEALDVLNLQYGLQHLDIKPANLFLIGHHLKVADFGLVREVGDSRTAAAPSPGLATPLYCSPEVFTGKVSPRSDQYSLAVVYQELATGKLPVTGANSRQLMLHHLQGTPDLEPLLPAERPVVARALAKDPAERFPCCLDFVCALLAAREQISTPTRLLALQRAAASPVPLAAPAVVPQSTPTEPTPKHDSTRAETASLSIGDTHTRMAHIPAFVAAPAPEPLAPPPPPFKAPALPTPGPLTIPGYELVKCLSQNNPGPMWEVRGPDQRCHVARVLPLEFHQGAGPLTSFLDRLRQTEHPALPTLGVVPSSHGPALLAKDLAGETLAARYQACVAQKLPGVPRDELLDHLSVVAEALDTLRQQDDLWHLGLNPFSLFIEEDGVCFTDFGLVHQLWLPAGLPLARCHLQYAAPEVLRGEPGERSDEYSLALLFAEMLTGFHPRPRATPGPQRGPSKLDLVILASTDQQVLRKALSDRPEDRFASCIDLVEALRGGPQPGRKAGNRSAKPLPRVLPIAALDGDLAASPGLALTPEQLVIQVFEKSGFHSSDRFRDGNYWRPADLTLECRLPLPALGLTLKPKLQAFAEVVQGKYAHTAVGAFTVHLPMGTGKSFWSRLTQQTSGLEVRIQVDRLPETSQEQTEAAVRIVPLGSTQFEDPDKVKALSLELVNRLRAALGLQPEQRAHVRVPFDATVVVYLLTSNLQVSGRIEGTAKNLSFGGLRATLPERPATPLMYLHFPDVPALRPYLILARLVDLKQSASESWEFSASFAEATATATGEAAGRSSTQSAQGGAGKNR